MDWIILICGSAVGVGLLVTYVLTSRHKWRFGTVAGTTEVVGADPYRRHEVTGIQARGVPARLRAASALGVTWGLLTGFIFAPAGLLFCMIQVDADAWYATLSALAVLGVSLHGFVLAVSLVALPHILVVRKADSVPRARRLAAVSLVHHVAVILAFALAAVDDDMSLGLFLAIGPCVLGIAHSILVSSASNVLEQLDREDTEAAAASAR